MTEFRFVQITLVIILGFGVTEILSNIGGQIRRRKEIEVYPLQVFVSCSLLFFILLWLWSFSQSVDVTWTLPVFFLQVLPTIALALSAQMIGMDFNSTKSLKQQYFDNCTATYLFLAIVPLLSVFASTTNLEYLPFTRNRLMLINIVRFVIAGFTASLGFIKKPLYHWSVVIGLLIINFVSALAFVFRLKF
jgi:hypothetical protein